MSTGGLCPGVVGAWGRCAVEVFNCRTSSPGMQRFRGTSALVEDWWALPRGDWSMGEGRARVTCILSMHLVVCEIQARMFLIIVSLKIYKIQDRCFKYATEAVLGNSHVNAVYGLTERYDDLNAMGVDANRAAFNSSIPVLSAGERRKAKDSTPEPMKRPRLSTRSTSPTSVGPASGAPDLDFDETTDNDCLISDRTKDRSGSLFPKLVR
ncbi:hypothetical protein DFJ77DRAFT_93527 [Powellomyces hirtus]|nr:hypothetical protein DFJ77DRAFT_93527 [Powellomyces hirtus]